MAAPLRFATYLPALHAPGPGLSQAVAIALTISGAVAIYILLLGLFGVANWRATAHAIRLSRPRDLRS
jgi:hypothetical protein